jgi:hypothetical protein
LLAFALNYMEYICGNILLRVLNGGSKL